MDSAAKIFLTAGLLLDMSITNYCYNTYGLSPDYNFFRTSPVMAVQSVAESNKVHFLSNYTPTYDNVVSSMAIMDDTVSTGALYIDHRSTLNKKIYVGNVHVQIPDAKGRYEQLFKYEDDADYAGSDESGKLFIDGRQAAAVRVKKDMVYRLSSSTDDFKIDGIGVGSYILDVVRIWGEPTKDEDGRIFMYPVGDEADITLIVSPDGFVTWMLYEGRRTELIENNTASFSESSTESTTEITTEHNGRFKREIQHPVADAVLMENHSTDSGGKKK